MRAPADAGLQRAHSTVARREVPALQTDRLAWVDSNYTRPDTISAVARLTDDDLRRPVTDRWTVADMLGHLAFWDARALSLAEKFEIGVAFSPADDRREDVDPMNAAAGALVGAMPPRAVAELAVRLAEATDRRVATLDPRRLWPEDPASPLNPLRASHRAEHLDHIEALLR